MEYYYLNTISLWNHPEQYSYPNPLLNQSAPSQTSDYEQIELGNTRKVNDESTDLDLNGNSGGDFVEKGFIHPIIPYAGDVILEGRFGNSIRFGSTQNINGKAISNNWSSTGESGSPIVILKNGQNPETQTEEPGWVPVSENINEENICQLSLLQSSDQGHKIFIFKNFTQFLECNSKLILIKKQKSDEILPIDFNKFSI